MKPSKSSIYISLFIVLIAIIGLLSCKNLISFYINDETNFNEWTPELGNKFEIDIATNFYAKNQFVNLNGAIRNVLGQHEMNGVVKLNNGYLLSPLGYVDDATLGYNVDKLQLLNQYLDSRDTHMLYVLAPYTSGKYDPQLPIGIEDYGNDDANRLMNMIQSANIDSLDMRDEMYLDGINHYDMTYKTDMHWNTDAGFYTYNKIEQYIKAQTGCDIDSRISDLSQYDISIYKNWHLGSRGQRTGQYFTGVDDFKLYLPKFDTCIIDYTGNIKNFQNAVINMDPLRDRQYTSRYTYDWVLGNSLGHFVNLNSLNNLKVLLITDSYGKAVAPFLILGFSEIRYIYNLDSSNLTKEYIENYNPDVVILLYYTENATNQTAYNFQIN